MSRIIVPVQSGGSYPCGFHGEVWAVDVCQLSGLYHRHYFHGKQARDAYAQAMRIAGKSHRLVNCG